MYARMTRTKVAPADQEKMVGDFEARVATPAKEQPGFQGIVLLVNRTTGEGVGITYWEDETALNASGEPMKQIREAATHATGATIVSVETAEILSMDRIQTEAKAGTFVRLNTVEGDAVKIDTFFEAYQSNVLPLLKAQKGIRAAIAAANRETGKIVVSTVWDSAAEREASDANLTEQRRQTAAKAGAANVKVELFESAYVSFPMRV